MIDKDGLRSALTALLKLTRDEPLTWHDRALLNNAMCHELIPAICKVRDNKRADRYCNAVQRALQKDEMARFDGELMEQLVADIVAILDS